MNQITLNLSDEELYEFKDLLGLLCFSEYPDINNYIAELILKKVEEN